MLSVECVRQCTQASSADAGIERLTRNRGTRVRGQHATPLQAQGHSPTGGRSPRQGGRLASLERISLGRDVEGVGLVGSGGREGRDGAEGQVEDGTHCCRVGWDGVF